MGDAQREARLLWELDVEGVGGQMVVADVNGDGKLEFLLRQSPGQLKSDLYIERGWNTDEERHLFCITAIDQDGDGRDEVLIYDRQKILVYGAPA